MPISQAEKLRRLEGAQDDRVMLGVDLVTMETVRPWPNLGVQGTWSVPPSTPMPQSLLQGPRCPSPPGLLLGGGKTW